MGYRYVAICSDDSLTALPRFFAECLDKPIQIASIQSLRSESRVYPPASLVVIDEAHCALADSVRELVEHYKVCHVSRSLSASEAQLASFFT